MPPLEPSVYVPAFVALAAVIAYQNKVTIPGLQQDRKDLQKELTDALQDRIHFSETAIPVMTRTNDLFVRVEAVLEKSPHGSA